MAQIICPNDGWLFKYKNYVGAEPVIEDGVVVASILNNDDTVKFISDKIDEDYEAWIYREDLEGISISAENKVTQNIKVTSPPSFFDIFELYMEDCNGVIATYGLTDLRIGKENTIDLTALVRGEDFNDAYVTKIGYRIKGPKAQRSFTLKISELRLSFMENPLYCTPQEVMDMIMLVDNRGEPFVISDTTIPSYNTIAKRIVEAEAFIEANTREAYVERRVEREICNADSAWPGTYGYYGILASSGQDYGAQSFFKGAPVKLTRSRIQPIDYTKGDLVEIRRYGSFWTTVPNGMIWQDETKGIVYIKSLFFQKDASIRITYRYGRGPIPGDIKRACLLKTAMLFVQTEWYIGKFPQSPEFMQMRENALNSWTWELKDILRNHSTSICVGGV